MSAASIPFKLTSAGIDAAFVLGALNLNVTHVQIGDGNATPSGGETALASPRESAVISGHFEVTAQQHRIAAVIAGSGLSYNVSEIGLWSGAPGAGGSVLVFYWSQPAGHVAVKSASVDFNFETDMFFGGVVPSNITIIADTQFNALAMLAAHEADPNSHSAHINKDVIGLSRNLKMSVAAAAATATLTADEVVVVSALGGPSHKIGGFNKTINLAITGAGGMDTGSAPASGFVALYAIYNPTTLASALTAVNATSAIVPEVYGGANMPSGYTYSALVSVWATNASGQFKIGFQFDRHISFPEIQVLSNLLNAPYVQFSLSAAVPFNAKECGGRLTVIATTSTVTTSALYIASDASGSGAPQLQVPGNASALGSVVPFSHLQLLTPQTAYYGTANGNGNAVFISDYSF